MKTPTRTLAMAARCLVLAASVALLGGCASTGNNFDESKVSQIKKGETTEAQLIQMFGEPQSRGVNSEGVTTLMWMYTESSVKGESFIPYAGAFVGGSRHKQKTLNVTLLDGKVQSFSSSAGGMETRGTTQAVSTPKRPGSQPTVTQPPTILAAGEPELWVIARPPGPVVSPADHSPGTGTLLAKTHGHEVSMPLKRMAVRASISGYIGAVEVSQEFSNPCSSRVEAVYEFPLPHNAAVNEFIMTIGQRRIRGIIRERQDAEQIYQEASRQGYRVALLTQGQSNTFTQSVANIEPGKQIDVSLKYFHTLAYASGWYEFVFPMAPERGHSYPQPASNPGGTLPSPSPNGDSHVAADRNVRAPDLSLTVDVDAGVPIEDFECKTHRVTHQSPLPARLIVSLDPADRFPDRDFVLRYRVAGERIKSGLLTTQDERGGYFTLILYPPREVGALARQPQDPLLANLTIDWGDFRAAEVFPRNLPDLFVGRPVILTGKFMGNRDAQIRVTGMASGAPVHLEIPARAPDRTVSHKGLAALWARMKIADLVEQARYAASPQMPRQIKELALDYALISTFTAFIAVDATSSTDGTGATSAPAAVPASANSESAVKQQP